MPAPIAIYRTSRHHVWAGLAAFGFSIFSAWVAWRWPYGWIATGLLLASAAVVLYFAWRPPIEVYETHLKLRSRLIPWAQIQRLDRTSTLPLIVQLTLADNSRVLVVYPSDPDSSNSLLRHLRRFSREALIEGVPYRQFWGEAPAAKKPKDKKHSPPAPPRAPLLLPDDEADIERMFQRLKTVGHIDQKTSDEK